MTLTTRKIEFLRRFDACFGKAYRVTDEGSEAFLRSWVAYQRGHIVIYANERGVRLIGEVDHDDVTFRVEAGRVAIVRK